MDRFTTEYLSFVPIGLSNFYKGHKFDGWCEVINAVMAAISVLAACCCYTHRNTDCIAAYIAIVTIILDLAKVIHMIANGSADVCEIVVMIASILLIYLYCCCVDHMRGEVYGIIPAALVTVATVALEAFRDIYTAAYNDKDGSDCPFI